MDSKQLAIQWLYKQLFDIDIIQEASYNSIISSLVESQTYLYI